MQKPSIEIETCETTNQEKKSLEVNAVYHHFQIWLLQLHYQKMLLSKQVIIFSLSLSDCQLDDELGWIFVWDCVIPMFPLFQTEPHIEFTPNSYNGYSFNISPH